MLEIGDAEMKKVKIALAQMRCEKGDWPGNLARAEEYMARARSEGCEIIVLPEMGLSGYCDPARFPEAIQPLASPWVRQFVDLTAKHGIIASGGFIERNPEGKPFITQVLAQDGRIVGIYRKIHVVDEEAEWFSPGTESPVFDVQLPHGKMKCALAVCADSDRPDLFSIYADRGARLVLHSSAPGLYGRRTNDASWQAGYDWYESYVLERLPIYARENELFIVVATQTGATIDEDFPGASFVFGPDGSCLACTGNYAETLLVHEITIPD